MKQKLSIDKYHDPENRRIFFGLSCHEKDYKAAWLLNTCLNIKLEKLEDYQINLPNAAVKQSFSFFNYCDQGTNICYTLIKNRSTEAYPLISKKEFDYILIIDNSLIEADDIKRKIAGAKKILYSSVFHPLKKEEQLLPQ